jgi:hypothetical protein
MPGLQGDLQGAEGGGGAASDADLEEVMRIMGWPDGVHNDEDLPMPAIGSPDDDDDGHDDSQGLTSEDDSDGFDIVGSCSRDSADGLYDDHDSVGIDLWWTFKKASLFATRQAATPSASVAAAAVEQSVASKTTPAEEGAAEVAGAAAGAAAAEQICPSSDNKEAASILLSSELRAASVAAAGVQSSPAAAAFTPITADKVHVRFARVGIETFQLAHLPVNPTTGRRRRLCYISRTNKVWYCVAAALAAGQLVQQAGLGVDLTPEEVGVGCAAGLDVRLGAIVHEAAQTPAAAPGPLGLPAAAPGPLRLPAAAPGPSIMPPVQPPQQQQQQELFQHLVNQGTGDDGKVQ